MDQKPYLNSFSPERFCYSTVEIAETSIESRNKASNAIVGEKSTGELPLLILFIRERNGLTIGVAILLVYSFNLPFGEIHDNKTSAKTDIKKAAILKYTIFYINSQASSQSMDNNKYHYYQNLELKNVLQTHPVIIRYYCH